MEKQRVQTPDESTPYAIEMLHITKRFPGIIANDDITLQLRHGESTRCWVRTARANRR